MFNALKYSEILENAGFSKEQAEELINTLIEIMDQNLASKQNINELRSYIDIVVKDVEHKIDNGGISLRHEIRELEFRMTVKLGAMLVLAVGLMTALQQLIH